LWPSAACAPSRSVPQRTKVSLSPPSPREGGWGAQTHRDARERERDREAGTIGRKENIWRETETETTRLRRKNRQKGSCEADSLSKQDRFGLPSHAADQSDRSTHLSAVPTVPAVPPCLLSRHGSLETSAPYVMCCLPVVPRNRILVPQQRDWIVHFIALWSGLSVSAAAVSLGFRTSGREPIPSRTRNYETLMFVHRVQGSNLIQQISSKRTCPLLLCCRNIPQLQRPL